MAKPNAPKFWRQYRGCRCYDSRTGLMKKGIKTCSCPFVVFVGKRRAKIMAREEARRG